MSSKTKIFVFKMKELIYTGIFLVLAALFIVLLVMMFRGGGTKTDEATKTSAVSYIPGVYHATIDLGEHNLEVAVAVDAEHINSISFTNLEEAVSVMYPLMQTSMEQLATQIITNQSTEDLAISDDSKYTGAAIVDAVERALEKAITP